MIGRNTLYSSPGGDTTQIEMTAKYLNRLGVLADISLAGSKINYDLYDLIHFFNIIRPDDILCHLETRKPFVLSTIFVEFSEFEKMARRGLTGFIFKILTAWQIEYVKSVARYLVKGDKIKSAYFLFHGQFKSMKYAAKKASLLLPNSHSEYRRVENSLRTKFPYKKIVNAIDANIFNEEAGTNEDFKDHVLMIGRIEGRKNQLNVIKALVGLPYQLTIIGKPALNQMSYYRECQQTASSHANIHFIEEHLEQNKLAGIYKAAKVHVLASWFETTGLSSLEAAAMGCNIVITKKGDTEEYFGEMAFYCEPDDVQSIRNAVLKAFETPRNCRLKSFVLQNYTWEKTALQTLDAYKTVLRLPTEN